MNISGWSTEAVQRQFLHDLHTNMTLHAGQVEVARAMFVDKKNVKVDCGRKWGKTTVATYIAGRTAGLAPDAPIYILAPWSKQVREIYWAPRLIQRLLHPRWIKKVYQQEMRVRLVNEAFIKFDGSDNPEIHRGPEMRLFVGDEFKDFDPTCWPAIEPNLLPKGGKYALFGTPPDNEQQPSAKLYLAMSKHCQTDPGCAYFRAPTSQNPHIPAEALEKIRKRYVENGDEETWLREYEGLFVKGGAKAVFPMFDKASRNTFTFAELWNDIRHDLSSLEWHCAADPGTATCFAQVFVCYNKHNGNIYVLDELYVTDQSENTVAKMYEKEAAIIRSLWNEPEEWLYTYDESALWFHNEREAMRKNYGWQPTNKALFRAQQGEPKAGISLMKDAMRMGKLRIAKDKCPHFVGEIEAYIKDENGKFPRDGDHLIDAFRYFLQRASYTYLDVQKGDADKPNPRYDGRSYLSHEPHEEVNINLDVDPFSGWEDEEWNW